MSWEVAGEAFVIVGGVIVWCGVLGWWFDYTIRRDLNGWLTLGGFIAMIAIPLPLVVGLMA